MAVAVGSIDTRILIAVGSAEPVEVGTLTVKLDAKLAADGTSAVLDARRWRRGMAVAFVRMAWATLTMHNERHRTTDPACTRHRVPPTWWGRQRYDRGRGRSCAPCMADRAAPAPEARGRR